MRRTRAPTEPDAIREDGIEALELLANEHRLAILRTLADADGPLAFSELRKRIGMRDTGRFNYHLSELQGRFVRQHDGRYELGPAGERLILAAADLDAETLGEGAGSGACPVCGDEDCEKLIHIHLQGESNPPF